MAAGVEKAFTRDDGKEFDYVFNLAAETKYGQTDEVYNEKIYSLSVTVAKEAAKRKAKAFVEVSTGQVYDGGKKASTEDSKLKPWTHMAKAKLKAEEELQKIPGLKLIICRPAICYGPADISGITPRLIIGAVYRQLKEEMKFLWTKDLRINTVHVSDVVRALWFVAAKKEQKGGRTTDITKTEIYNLADKGDTDQGSVNAIIESVFGIETGFQGTMISQFAKVFTINAA
jgi:nucleoside-diphosphate-sugar epimerase